MIRAWLELPTIGIFLSLTVLFYGMAALLALAAFRSSLAGLIRALEAPVAPFFSSVAVLFALLAGFLANDISERSRQAFRATQVEAGELRNIYTLSVAAASDMQSIRTALKDYVTSVATQEWPAMADGRMSPPTDAAYDGLLREVSNPAIARSSGNAVHAALLNATVRVGTARNDRLAIASDHTNDLKWIVVLVLGLFTQLAIALVHLDKPRAFILALSVFSGAVVVALGIIALQEYPFYGTFRLSPAPIAQLQSLPDALTPPLPKAE